MVVEEKLNNSGLNKLSHYFQIRCLENDNPSLHQTHYQDNLSSDLIQIVEYNVHLVFEFTLIHSNGSTQGQLALISYLRKSLGLVCGTVSYAWLVMPASILECQLEFWLLHICSNCHVYFSEVRSVSSIIAVILIASLDSNDQTQVYT